MSVFGPQVVTVVPISLEIQKQYQELKAQKDDAFGEWSKLGLALVRFTEENTPEGVTKNGHNEIVGGYFIGRSAQY